MPDAPTGTVTFLFTDIEGSTRLWEQYPQQMRSALSRHDAILREAIEGHGGYVFKTVGDAFCASFAAPTDAVLATLSAQRTLHSGQWPQELGEFKVRMALHTGEVALQEGDYFGPPVNRVARILSAGHGGQTLLSEVTYRLVRDALPSGVAAKDMGEHRLKDLTRPERVFQLLAPSLPSEFAPLKSLDYRPNNLPLQPTPLIGREKEVVDVTRLLRTQDVRLVTLTGPGGIGKTRLGLQAGAELLDTSRDGVWFVNLAPIIDPALVVSQIAQTLGVPEAGGTPLLDSLKGYLRDKHLLLLLDNFEQVVEARSVVTDLLGNAPGLKLLITSRVPLQVRGEKDWSVPPLSLPDAQHLPLHSLPLEKLTQYEAVRLFIERATDARSDFQVTNDNAPAVAEICVRLDGLPLAIELAAARVRLLTPRAMLSRLEGHMQSRLKLLTGGAKDLPARQQTLRNTIEWSYELLSPQEQKLFRRLAVFAGGRALEAIEAVCNAEGDLEIEVLDGVDGLVTKSMLRQEAGVGGEPRFVMLETIHEYARERLDENGEGDSLRSRHADYFLALAEKAEPELRGAGQAVWFARLEEEHDNLRAALSWTLSSQATMETAARLASALQYFWRIRGHFREGMGWLEAVVAKSDQLGITVRTELLLQTQGLALELGDYDRTTALLQIVLALAQEAGDQRRTARALLNLAWIAAARGDHAQAASRGEQALAVVGAQVLQRWGSFLGEIARMAGDYEQAAVRYEEALQFFETQKDKLQIGLASANLSHVENARGNYRRARELCFRSLHLFREVGYNYGMAMALVGLSGAVARLDAARSATLLGAASRLLNDLNISLELADKNEYEKYEAVARTFLSDLEYQGAWAAGAAMSMEEAIECALEFANTQV